MCRVKDLPACLFPLLMFRRILNHLPLLTMLYIRTLNQKLESQNGVAESHVKRSPSARRIKGLWINSRNNWVEAKERPGNEEPGGEKSSGGGRREGGKRDFAVAGTARNGKKNSKHTIKKHREAGVAKEVWRVERNMYGTTGRGMIRLPPPPTQSLVQPNVQRDLLHIVGGLEA